MFLFLFPGFALIIHLLIITNFCSKSRWWISKFKTILASHVLRPYSSYNILSLFQDIYSKIISFCQKSGSYAVCILSANGTVSRVTLLKPAASLGTITYEVMTYYWNSQNHIPSIFWYIAWKLVDFISAVLMVFHFVC